MIRWNNGAGHSVKLPSWQRTGYGMVEDSSKNSPGLRFELSRFIQMLMIVIGGMPEGQPES